MESFSRRPIERPVRRPIMDGSVARPTQPHPATASSPVGPSVPHSPAQPSLLKPPTIAASGPSMDIRPAGSPARHPVPQPLAAPVATQHSPFHPNIRPHASPQPPVQQSTPLKPLAAPVPRQTPPTNPRPQEQKSPAQPAKEKLDLDLPKHHKQSHPTAHAGLVGFVIFLVFGMLCLAPLLPGKIWNGAPGSSDSFSTGDQNLDCLSALGAITTATTYDHKIGFPVVYSYATTSRQSASCQGKTLHATGGHTSQFNPLGLLMDTMLALVIAIVSAKIWRKLRAHKD